MMTENLLRQLEDLIGSDDFEFEAEEIMEQLVEEGAGFEIVGELFSIMERHPVDDLGMPGPMVHFIEQYHPEHIPLLISSVKRAPTLHTVWMLNRCINGSADRDEYISILKEAAENENADKAVRDSARSFLDYQLNR